jgi:aryl-alcohol dehydrogenase-like predicted oxidoreductase
MHHIDRTCPVDEWLSAMATLQQQGKIYYVGSSNFAGWDLATACTTADLRVRPRLVSEQSLYNLASRTVELEVIPACLHFGVGLIPWSPLGAGLLGGALAKTAAGRRTSSPDFEKQVNAKRPQLERYENLCRQLGYGPADVALAWLLAQPVVTAPIIGPRTMDQFADAMRALELKLAPETLRQLDEIFPGPGGSAPEAYSW